MRHARSGVSGPGPGIAPLPVQGVRSDVQCGDGRAAVGAASQGAVAVVRRGSGDGGDGKGLGRALLRVDGTAFRWRRRFLKAVATAPDKLKRIVEADETYVLESRKGERLLKRKARRRGGKASKRGLSREQVPILTAAARGGATVSAVLPAVTADALRNALGPAVARDILLRRPSLVSPLRGRARRAPRGAQRDGRRTGAWPSAHSDGEQPPRSVQGFPPRLPGRRCQIPRQLPAMVPPRRLAPQPLPENTPRRSNRKSYAYESIIEPFQLFSTGQPIWGRRGASCGACSRPSRRRTADIAGPDSKIVALKAGLRPGAQIQSGGIVAVVAALKLFG